MNKVNKLTFYLIDFLLIIIRRLKSILVKLYYIFLRIVLNIKVKEFDEKVLYNRRVNVIRHAETALDYTRNLL